MDGLEDKKLVTTEEMDTLKKQVHDIAELAKKTQGNFDSLSDNVAKVVEKELKSIVSKRFGHTEQRVIQFPNEMTDEQKTAGEIMETMPTEAKYELDNSILISKLLKMPVNQTKTWRKFSHIAGDFKKALDATTTNQGAEWVPTDFSSQLWEKVHLQLKVAALFPIIQMPTNPFKLPIEIADMETFVLAEQTADTGQTKMPVSDTSGQTDNATLTAKWHGGRVLVSKILEQDSIIAMLPFLRTAITRGLALGREDFILNGDTAGTHEDSDITSSTDRRKHFLGLRAAANEYSYKTDLSTFNLTNLRQMRENMGVYGIDPLQLAWIPGFKGFFKLLNLPEVLTLDKLGSNATIIQGQLAAFDGSPVIPSEKIRQTLNASGVYDGVTTTKSVLHCVYRSGHIIGQRSETNIQLLQELYAESGQDALLIQERIAFRDSYPIASNRTTEIGYNF